MSRPDIDDYFIAMAYLVATRSTCQRRKVGAVLVNKFGHVLATGYNGVAAGRPHCNEGNYCAAAFAESGMNLEGCEAIHAEQNALLQCRNVQEIEVCYTTASPCITCTKLLLNTSCHRIVFGEEYPQSASETFWTSADKLWEQNLTME